MKNLQKFAENQLSKDEMNNVKGGGEWLWSCNGGSLYLLESQFPAAVEQLYAAGGGELHCQMYEYIKSV